MRSQVFCSHQWREPGMRTEVVRAFHRQKVRISPHAARTVLDLLPRYDLLHLGIVVFDFKRAEAHLTDVNGLGGILLPAFPTYERLHFGHRHTTFIITVLLHSLHTDHRRRTIL